MKLSEALERELFDASEFPFARYGFSGDIADAAAVQKFLADNPHINAEFEVVIKEAGSISRRPEQRKFRERLLVAYGGKCAVTGSNTESVLEAAHLRAWTENNHTSDGILLRVDLHRLMEKGLLIINRDYTVSITDRLGEPYDQLDGKKVSLPKLKQDWPRIT